MAHKDIRIQFEVEGRRYEAVGFLAMGELSVVGHEMLQRTSAENSGAVSEEDEAFLRRHLDQLPVKLRGYSLISNRRCPGHPQGVSCFIFDGRPGWNLYIRRLDGCWWVGRDLVVRRCA